MMFIDSDSTRQPQVEFTNWSCTGNDPRIVFVSAETGTKADGWLTEYDKDFLRSLRIDPEGG